jgi:hypothetical protein
MTGRELRITGERRLDGNISPAPDNGLQAKGYRQILRRRSKTIVISSKTTTAVRDLTQVKIADPVYFERICGGSLQNAADEVDEGSLEWMCGLEKQ